jgi:diaminohydroxyphosphoribosylaminopyrimidine deaminase/5-amino-6-(5-phosphoribosylamino)uracil reductase
MRRCLELAANGMGEVAPNPMVGCVIVCDGQIIGEGFHRRYGEAHAEVNAIRNVTDPQLLQESKLYVSLEPCAHYGKTPPCADLIIEKGIPEVIIAATDVNPKVAGEGVKKVREAGIRVTTGVLEKEANFLNRRFNTFHLKKRPYILLKWAQTADGFIDVAREASCEPSPTWITSPELKALVHKWRCEESAIMTGTRTVLMDNPELTAREWSGRNPLRVVIDEHLKIPEHFAILNDRAETLVITALDKEKHGTVEYLKMDFSKDILAELMDELYRRQVQSMIVEGGQMLLESFILCGLWDEARVFTANKYFVNGIKAPVFPYKPFSVLHLNPDVLTVYLNH